MVRFVGMARVLAASLMLLCLSCGSAFAQSSANDYGIALGPGETLVAVDGVPVEQLGSGSVCRGGTCTPVRSTIAAAAALPRAIVANTAEVMQDARAYAHAKREAQMQASLGRYGHFLGVAPGCTMSGVGVSFSESDPNHCQPRSFGILRRRSSPKQLVARASAVGADGRVYWSAHYR